MAEARPVLISGATGLLGSRLASALCRDGVPVRALTRNPDRAARALPAGCTPVAWDGTRCAPEEIAGAAALVHLAGEPLFAGRLTPSRRRRVYASRVDSTRNLVAALGELRSDERPAALVCASAVGIYGSRGEETLDEASPPGRGFLAELCQAWEGAAGGAGDRGVRSVCLRLGIVLAREGGALPTLARPFRLGLGAQLGDGQQWFPWVHIDDAVSLCRLALADAELRGPVNVVAPAPVRNAELTRRVAAALGRPAFLRIPSFALRLALGELAEELLGSRRVAARAAGQRGYVFGCASIEDALARELGGGR